MSSSCWQPPLSPSVRARECSGAECSVPLSICGSCSQCPLHSQVGSCHHDQDPVTADAAHQDDCPGHLGQDDRLLSQRYLVRSVLDKYRRYCLLFCWFIWRTSGLWQMPNNHASSDVAADNNSESYIQYLSHHLSYHKRGVEEGDDSIRY